MICSKRTLSFFYFSGHGGKTNGKNCLFFSTEEYSLQDLINEIDRINVKTKVIFLDCCHSGSFVLDKEFVFDIKDDIESFARAGIAVLSSCGANEVSGFDNKKQISLFTTFLSDTLNNKLISRQGQKSLESIAELVRRYADIWNNKSKELIQHPIYRSVIGGTVFFAVDDYQPYKVINYYEECEKYIIYKVEPVHVGAAKRLSAKVILRYPFTFKEIAIISKEIKKKIIYCEIYQNQNAENYYFGKPANIIWCYFGFDEDDMVNSNYICHTTWVDNTQDKSLWYRKSKNSMLINDVFFDVHTQYNAIKNLNNKAIDIDEFINQSRESISRIIIYGEKYISLFREYLNNILSEKQFINLSQQYISEINKWYIKETDLDIPPNDLHDWSQIQIELAGSLHDCSLYYNIKSLDKWTTDNRKWLMSNSIKQYETNLEKYKKLDAEVYRKHKSLD